MSKQNAQSVLGASRKQLKSETTVVSVCTLLFYRRETWSAQLKWHGHIKDRDHGLERSDPEQDMALAAVLAVLA